MTICLRPTMRRPLASMREMRLPTSPRRTPSGLTIAKVRSVAISRGVYHAGSGPKAVLAWGHGSRADQTPYVPHAELAAGASHAADPGRARDPPVEGVEQPARERTGALRRFRHPGPLRTQGLTVDPALGLFRHVAHVHRHPGAAPALHQPARQGDPRERGSDRKSTRL